MSDAAGWPALGLTRELQRAAQALRFGPPTPIQAAALPAALAGRDLLATAPTGSGKTAAYAFALLQRLQRPAKFGPRLAQALVLVPTRELVVQVGETLQQLAGFLPVALRITRLHGGVSINPQLMGLRGGTDVVLATPGRLLDVVAHHALDLSDLGLLVLDEADRLLDGAFADELGRVLALLRPPHQTLLFSATFPAAVQALATRLLHEPLRVDVAPAPAAPEVLDASVLHERVIAVDAAQRTPLLRHLIEHEGWTRVLVFVATRYACEHVAAKLRQGGFEAAGFHGDASQGARSRVLADFKAGRLRALVATDLGARGLDIVHLPVVVNHDLPRAAVDYVHRVGRTARAGAPGLAVSFVSAATEAHFRLIEKRQGRRIPREQVAGFEPTEAPPPADASHDGTGGVKGRRPSKKDKLRAAEAEAAAAAAAPAVSARRRVPGAGRP